MRTSDFSRLEDVILNPHFPVADVLLRRGRHIDRDDGELYLFLRDAAAQLEPLYRRFACDLVHMPEGAYFLVSTGDQISRRVLTSAEMLVGQTLALLAREPETVQTAGLVRRARLLERLRQLLGDDELVRLLAPSRKKSARVAEQNVRDKVEQAVKVLGQLGFVTEEDGDAIRARACIHRFAEPVRTAGDLDAALEGLIRDGRIVLGSAEDDPVENDV